MMRSNLSDSLRQYLESGDYRTRETFPNCPGRVETFLLANPGKRQLLREKWLQHRAEILADWKRQKRAGLPWAAVQFDEE